LLPDNDKLERYVNPSRTFYFHVPMSWDDPVESIETASVAAITLGNVLLVIDEADLRLGPQINPPAFTKLIHTSRHWGVSVFVTARRAQGLPTLLRAVATKIHVFRTRLPGDREYIRGETGDEPPGLRSLKVGERWEYSGTGWKLIDRHGTVLDSLD